MAKSIFLALFVLGVSQALAVPEESKEYYREIGIAFVGGLSEEISQKAGLQDSQNEALEEYLREPPTIKLIGKIARLLPNEQHHQVYRRAVDELKNQIETEIMPEVGELVTDMDKNGVNITSVDKIRSLLNKVEEGVDSVERAVGNESVKELWKFLCNIFVPGLDANEKLSRNADNATELVEQVQLERSFGQTACSEETYQETKVYIKKAKEIIKKINDFLTRETLEKIRKVVVSVINSVKRAAKAVWNKFG